MSCRACGRQLTERHETNLQTDGMDFGMGEFEDVSPAVWAIIMVMGLVAMLKMYGRYRTTRRGRYRKASIGCALMSMGIAVYLFADLSILALAVSTTGFVVLVASGVIRLPI